MRGRRWNFSSFVVPLLLLRAAANSVEVPCCG